MSIFHPTFTQAAVDDAVAALNGGGVALLPADTVYAFYGRCDIKRSTERVYDIKHRDRGKPFTLYTNENNVERWAELNDTARMLIKTFWPRALTLVLPHTDALPAWYTGIGTVGVLTAMNPLIAEVTERVDGPIFGTTVNYSGEPSIIHASEAMHFLDKVDVMIGDDSVPVYNAHSTILDCTIDPPAVLRRGVIPLQEIAEVVDGFSVDLIA